MEKKGIAILLDWLYYIQALRKIINIVITNSLDFHSEIFNKGNSNVLRSAFRLWRFILSTATNCMLSDCNSTWIVQKIKCPTFSSDWIEVLWDLLICQRGRVWPSVVWHCRRVPFSFLRYGIATINTSSSFLASVRIPLNVELLLKLLLVELTSVRRRCAPVADIEDQLPCCLFRWSVTHGFFCVCLWFCWRKSSMAIPWMGRCMTLSHYNGSAHHEHILVWGVCEEKTTGWREREILISPWSIFVIFEILIAHTDSPRMDALKNGVGSPMTAMI